MNSKQQVSLEVLVFAVRPNHRERRSLALASRLDTPTNQAMDRDARARRTEARCRRATTSLSDSPAMAIASSGRRLPPPVLGSCLSTIHDIVAVALFRSRARGSRRDHQEPLVLCPRDSISNATSAAIPSPPAEYVPHQSTERSIRRECCATKLARRGWKRPRVLALGVLHDICPRCAKKAAKKGGK